MPRALFLRAEGRLAFDEAPVDASASDSFVSDPRRPVPFSEEIALGMTQRYMTDDQRFASRRPDVLTFRTEPLASDVTLAGPLLADLWVATSRDDADWVVKLIDVFPDDFQFAPEDRAAAKEDPTQRPMGGYQMMVRSEVIRGRYRESYSLPKRFTPGEPANVRLPLQDVLHTFRKGHRIMIQVQSTWFPLVDRNPQAWVDNLFLAVDDVFQPATHQVFREAAHASKIELLVLPPEPPAPAAPAPAAGERK